MSRPSNKNNRPKIWAEGSQNPPFQPRAFAGASVIFARDSLSGLLGRCAESADGFSQTVATGRWHVPAHRLGRTGRYLPSVATTAAGIMGTAGLLRRTARVILPEPAAAAPSIFDAVVALDPSPPQSPAPTKSTSMPTRVQRAPAPAARALQSTSADPDLAAIRAMMDASAPPPAPTPPPAHLRPAPAHAPALARPAELVTGPNWRQEWLANAVANGLGYGLLAMAMPVGLTRALIAHLAGEDLREMVDETKA